MTSNVVTLAGIALIVAAVGVAVAVVAGVVFGVCAAGLLLGGACLWAGRMLAEGGG